MTLLTRLANRLTEMDGKSETVKQLAATFNCPYTSLYIPIRELEDAGFLKLKRGTGIVIYGSNPKEPEAVHGNEAEKEVCKCADKSDFTLVAGYSYCNRCGLRC